MDTHSSTSDPIADLQIDCNESEIKKCFCLLEEGDKRITSDQKEVILVLGITGSGKSTLIQFLAGNEEDLSAVETGGDIGEYTIIDKANKISGNDTIVSKTIIPERITDSRTNTTFYDCPGFSDTRGTAIDISGAYFIHKIIRSIDKVKILVTVNYSSLRTGLDRGNFLLLMEHLLKLIKNVDKYKKSIALVVTKVENQFNKKQLVKDRNMLDYMVKFLRKFKVDISKIRDPPFVRNVGTLIDTLTEADSSGYRRIGMFRRPIEEGSLATQKPVQDGKKRIIQIISQNLQFVDVDLNDFGYTISEQSKNDIQAIVDNINQFIVQRVKQISREVSANYEMKEVGIVAIEELNEIFENGLQKTRDFIEKLDENLNVSEFVDKLITFFSQANISKKHWSSILDQENYLNFLELVGEKKLAASSLIWKPGFGPIVAYLDISAKWYSFLSRLQKLLSSYDLQKNVGQYRYLLNQKIFDMNDERLKRFADTQPKLRFSEVQNLQIEQKKLEILNKILDSTLSANITVHYDTQSDTYRIHSDYVLLSKVIEGYAKFKKTKFLTIFAMDTVFIDCDLVRKDSSLHQLSIIAPTWEIVGERKIILNGQDGIISSVKAADGMYKGDRGSIGSPGLPGKSAGHFFGIGTNFINSHKLTISADGGTGGRGQDGGDGIAGSNGSDTLIQEKDGCRLGDAFSYARKRHIDGIIFRDYCIMGSPGGNGGNGGHGGSGGEGGHAGNVKLFALNKSHDVVVSYKKGARGHPGMGGRGGAGGQPAISWVHEKIIFWWRGVDCDSVRQRLAEYPSCPEEDQYRNGIPGTDGQAGENKWDMKQPLDIDTQNPSSIINEFKELYREALARKTVNQKKGMEFLKGLTGNVFAIQLYNATDIVEEFMNLENDYSKHKSHFDFQPLYKQLLNRVEKQLEKMSPDHNRLLKRLSTTLLSKIFLLEDEPENKFVINMQEYLDSVNSEIENVNAALRQQSQSRINSIKNEIEDMRTFLQDDILGQTETILQKLKDEVMTMSTELYILEQKAAEKEEAGPLKQVAEWGKEKFFGALSNIPLINFKPTSKIETNEQWKKLQNRLALLQMFEAVYNVGQFLNFANNFAKNVAENPVSLHKQPVFTDLPQLLDHDLGLMKKVKFEARLIASRFNELHIDNMTDLPSHQLDKLKKVRAKLENASAEQLQTSKSELKVILSDIDTDLRKTVSNNKILEARRLINNILISIHLLDAGFEKISSMDQSTAMLLDFALQNPRVRQLQFYVQEVLSIVSNTIESITKHTSEITMLEAQLRIQSAVSNFKPLIKKINEDMQLSEEMSTCYDKVEESTKMVFATFERLKCYEQLIRLVQSMNDDTLNDSLFKLSDKNLQLKANILNSIIEYNLLLNQYQNARKVVDRFVFPFGKVHESEFGLQEDEFRDVKKAVIQKIRAMNSAIEKYRTSLDAKHEGYRNESDFNNDASTAFYTWSSNEYRNTIADLLDGKRVVLKADIAKGVQKNAVKFDTIKINLKSLDKELDKQLKADLSNITVSLTHFGNSYYRCKNEVYVFELEKQNIIYSFATDDGGQPKYKNSIYNRIENGDFILSPYSMWAIQLTGSKSAFDTIRKYKGKVDIFLEGHGQYVEDLQMCDDTLKSYYKLDSVILENMVQKKQPLKDHVSNMTGTESSNDTQQTLHLDEITGTKNVTSTSENIPETETLNGLDGADVYGNETVKQSSNQLRRKRNISNQNRQANAEGIRENEIKVNERTNGYFKYFESDYFKGKANYIAYENNDNAANELLVNPQYSFNDGLLLMDLIIRKVTKSKPNYFKECRANNDRARICALNITNQLEQILQSTSRRPEELDFDPIQLMGKLEKEIINGNRKNIQKILLQTVENESTLDQEQFVRQIQKDFEKFYRQF